MLNSAFPLDEQYVLFVDDELAACILHCRNTGKPFASVRDMRESEEVNDPDTYEALMEYLDEIDLGERYHNFSGIVTTAKLDKPRLHDVLRLENDAIAFLSPIEESDLFSGPAYGSVAALVAEYHKRMGYYLPKDFDVRANICHVYGVYDYC